MLGPSEDLNGQDPKELMRKNSVKRVPRKSTNRKRSRIGERSRANQWSLPRLLAGLHDDIHSRLETARKTLQHPGTKGDASEHVWLQLLDTYLPKRYQVTKAHVVDSDGKFSEQIDVVVFDRQYSPFIFKYEGQTVVPAESIYAVFESKQSITTNDVAYAQNKIGTVRRLHRTSLAIPHAGGMYPPKPVHHIIGGLLTFQSEWKPPLGQPLLTALKAETNEGRLDLGCVAAHGTFGCDSEGCFAITPQAKPATAFLFELIARLQQTATVPMIDIRAYARWLSK